MFNFLETPDEIMTLINEAEKLYFEEELNNLQLKIPFGNGETETNSSEG
jgi:predicted RNase H-like HicB family nuclease